MYKRMFTGAKLTPRTALLLAAPRTWLPCSIMPCVFGVLQCAVRGCYVGFLKAMVLTAICVLMQSSVNTFNDFFDFLKGTDSESDNLEKDDNVIVSYAIAPVYTGVLAALPCRRQHETWSSVSPPAASDKP